MVSKFKGFNKSRNQTKNLFFKGTIYGSYFCWDDFGNFLISLIPVIPQLATKIGNIKSNVYCCAEFDVRLVSYPLGPTLKPQT